MKRFLAIVGLLTLLSANTQMVARSESSRPAARMIRVLCLPSRPLALVVAQEQHLFEKYGVEVEAEVANNSEALRAGLADEKFDLAHAAVDNAVALAEKNGSDVVVLLGGEGSTNELIAQPAFHSIAELRGKTVIVDAPTTAYALQLKKILLQNQLQAEKDYQIKAVGSTPLRLAALREHKEYAASILGPPTSLVAKHEGFVSLGTTQQFIGPYQAVSGFSRRTWAEQNREVLVSYIAAFVEAQRWIQDPAHKGVVVALLEKEFKTSVDLAQETYDAWIIAAQGLQRDARIDLAGFQTVLALRAELENSWNGKPPEPGKYYDSTFYDAALARANAAK
jgi:ABC-type nitrate/sulfonate/bicarbonate transport system substrate-binding protein